MAADPGGVRGLAIAAFAAVAYGALLIFAGGMLSLFLDRDLSPAAGGPLVGAAMVGASTIVVAVSVAAWAAARSRSRADGAAARGRVPAGYAVLVGVAAWLAYGIAGGAAAWVDGGAAAGADVALGGLGGPFGLAAGVLGIVVTVSTVLVIELGGDDPRRPLWPWER